MNRMQKNRYCKQLGHTSMQHMTSYINKTRIDVSMALASN